MKNSEIYNKWTKFITSEKYIDTNNKRPSSSDKNKEIKILSKWISHQITNYKSKGKIMIQNIKTIFNL
jgi:hypothetical protein